MGNRSDTYNLSADLALETAIDTLMALQQNEGTDKFRLISRDEALRFLTRRALKKNTTDHHRVRAAKIPGTSQ
jgi:hypothetical protein